MADADAFALVTANELKATIGTGDPELSAGEKEFEVVWIKYGTYKIEIMIGR